jgi:hypothetical protein
VVDQRKQAVSIRLGESDIRNIKRIAKRLGVRDSDIIRFAIKSTLKRIAPLCDPGIRGRNLVPVLVESGDELIRHFELDAFRLDTIINDNADAGRQVDYDDIALLAMSGLREEYLVMRLSDGSETAELSSRNRSLRGYLYDKYVYRGGAEQAAPANGHATATNGHATAKSGRDETCFPADGGVMVQIRPVGSVTA